METDREETALRGEASKRNLKLPRNDESRRAVAIVSQLRLRRRWRLTALDNRPGLTRPGLVRPSRPVRRRDEAAVRVFLHSQRDRQTRQMPRPICRYARQAR